MKCFVLTVTNIKKKEKNYVCGLLLYLLHAQSLSGKDELLICQYILHVCSLTCFAGLLNIDWCFVLWGLFLVAGQKYLEIEILSTPIIESRVLDEDAKRNDSTHLDASTSHLRLVTRHSGKNQRRSSRSFQIEHCVKPRVSLVNDIRTSIDLNKPSSVSANDSGNGNENKNDSEQKPKSYRVKSATQFVESIENEKYHVYKELVSKFVLEYENSDIRDDLWPWYENFKHRSNPQHIEKYFEIFAHFSDTRLTGHNSSDNLARKNSKKGQKKGKKTEKTEITKGGGSDSKRIMEYRHVRYLRKFAARYLLSQHSIEKSLFYIQIQLKNSRETTQKMKQREEQIQQQKFAARRTRRNTLSQVDYSNSTLRLPAPATTKKSIKYRDLLESLLVEKSALSNDDTSVDTNKENEYIVTEEDRRNLQENHFLNEETSEVLLKNYKRNDDIQHKTRENMASKSVSRSTTNIFNANSNANSNGSSKHGKMMKSRTYLDVKHRNILERVESDGYGSGNDFGFDHFFDFWIAVPDYWTVNHDMLLLELGLMFQLNVEKYKTIVTENKFFETWVENLDEGRKFVEWFQNKLNVMHRLRYLTYIIIYKEKPKSSIFVNRLMRDSHIKYINGEKGSLDENKLANEKDKAPHNVTTPFADGKEADSNADTEEDDNDGDIEKHHKQAEMFAAETEVKKEDGDIGSKKEDGDIDIIYSNDVDDNLDEKQWSSWTAEELSRWIEIKLRNGIKDAGYINADRMDMKIKDEIEIKIANFMNKFKDQELTGPLLKSMKQSEELKSQFKSMMQNYGFGYWIIVSTAIDSLHHNNDNNKKHVVAQEVDSIAIAPVRDIFGEFRDVVRLLEPQTFGPRIWKFIIGELEHKQRESLWKALEILADELPSKLMIKFLEQDKETIRRGKLEYIEQLCRSVVGASLYPMAMALHVSRFMDENASRDLARYNKWKSMADMFENIAIELVYEIENDFLLALLMEIPTDIGRKSVLELAITYHRTSFCNDARISALLSHMWGETEFLNPKHGIKASNARFDKIYKLLYESPVAFYFCPMGLYYTTTYGYILYVLIMTYMTYQQYYPYAPLDLFQDLFWIMNVGYIFYEISEAFHKGAKYFSLDSILNVFDVIISFNWIVLLFIRCFPDVWEEVFGWEYCDPCCDHDDSNDCKEKADCIAYCGGGGNDEYEVCHYGCSNTSHNRTLTLIYMAFWSVQCVILWIRVIGLFQRTKLLGPFLRVLMIIFTDLLSFFLLAGVVFAGFTYALYFIVAGDFERDPFEIDDFEFEVPEDDEITVYLGSVKGSALYLLQTFLGQQDWEILGENETYTFGRARARIAEGLLMLFILFGTILLLNLLIAVMANTFTLQQQQAQKELAFSRLETTYDLAHRGRLMPPPYNLFARLIWIGLEIVFYCIAFHRMYKSDNPEHEFDEVQLVEKLNPYFSERFHTIEDKLISHDNSKETHRTNIKKENQIFDKEVEKIRISQDASSTDLGQKHVRERSMDSNDDTPNVIDMIRVETYRGHDVKNSDKSVFAIMKIIEKEGEATSSKKYCRFCYFRMHTHKGGDIESYFDRLEESGYALDDEDEKRIARLFRYCELCPLCYRPFGAYPPKKSAKESETVTYPQVDRYARHKVFSEIASFYVFLAFVWIPLLILLAIPALISYYFSETSKLDNTKNIQSQNGDNNNSNHNENIFNIDPFADYHKGTWHNSIKKTIARVKLSQNYNDDHNNSNNSNNDMHTQENEM